MRLPARVVRLEKRLRVASGAAPKQNLTRLLTGKTSKEICDAVEAAISPQDHELVAQIEKFGDEAEKTPRIANSGDVLRDSNGEIVHEEHFFISWLIGLSVGSWSLPYKMPRAGLEGFNDRYGCVLWRCEGCLMGLGNGRRWESCPVCSGKDITQKKLSGPPWDAAWVYTPMKRG